MALHDPRPLDFNADEASTPETRATFGRYLLFRKLKQDTLGEVHRAGRIGADAIERIVSLRLFNAGEIDGTRFRDACRVRDPLQSVLCGGPYLELVDFGCHEGVAWVAHDFVFGRSLAELLVESREKSDPMPLEHTLHVMDRIAIALQNAYETRLGDRRVLHGFLVPEFVHISGEGEVRLSGFESAHGLLDLSAAGPARSPLAGYISPEVNAGQPPKASDDVYSLGAILAELLTGEPLPALNPAESSRWVAAATLAGEGEPLPDDVRHLVRESLLPRDQRIGTAEQWHAALVEIVSASGRTSTTFDVAFYMHTLFGDQLDREAQLVEVELKADVPPPAPAPVEPPAERVVEPRVEAHDTPPIEAEAASHVEPPTPNSASPAPPKLSERLSELAAGSVEAPAPATEEPMATTEPAPAPEAIAPPVRPRPATTESKVQAVAEERSRRPWIALGALALLAALGVGGYFLFGAAREPDAAPIQVTQAPRLEVEVPAPPPTEVTDIASDISAVPPPLSPEELESQVRSLVAQRAGDLEANLKAEYDQRLVELRRQLEEARKASSADPAQPSPGPAAASQAAAAPTSGERRAPAPEVVQPETPPAAQSPTPAAAESARPVQTEPSTPASTGAQPARQAPPPVPEERVAPPEPRPVRVEPKPQDTAPKVEAVEPGSIVTIGPGVTPPTLIEQPQAAYPPAAMRLKREATVRLRILVDESGRPSEIEQISKKAGLGFDAAALRAAKKTVWTPPEKNGVPVRMWVELSIDFRP